jgi:hypothetical protein
MHRTQITTPTAVLLVLALLPANSRGADSLLPPAAERTVDFAKDIQPLLQKNCYSCHGSEHQEGGLRLDQKKRALEGGDSGAEIVAGKSADSRLVRLLAGTDEDFGLMPPEGKGTRLSAEEIGLVRAWIDQGAAWPDDAALAAGTDHWSLQPVVRPPLPEVKRRDWPRGPVDIYILARLEREKIAPAPPAERTTLLRRLSLDLVGLPPTPDDVAEFMQDSRPDAVERVIDRLLASPHFGERWGRHWLDLARYADSDGYEKDRPRPFAFKYRDWVIRAINADLPFDRFTAEQLAGDLLPGAGPDERTASGLHRNTLHNTEGGADPEEDRIKKTIDRTNTLGAVWLGLTVGCAQCHSHKYDPLTQREYYQLFALFNSLEEKDLELPSQAQAAALAAAQAKHAEQLAKLQDAVKQYEAAALPAAQGKWEASLAGLPADKLAEMKVPADAAAAVLKPADQRSTEETASILKHYRTLDAELIKLEKAVTDHKAKPPALPEEAKVQAVAEVAQPRVTKILLRGDFLSPGDAVEPGTPAFLPALKPQGTKATRLDLAAWLADPANPLPARVAVNRYWHRLFGRGIVPTLDDFGKQGEQPSHPALLDWLASEFASRGWSQKVAIRTIVQSAAYQQSSTPRSELIDIDPENVLVARQSRRRAEAEVIRDLALSAAGVLTNSIGGPSVRPPQPAEYANVTYANSARWVESQGADKYRRGLYTFFQRTSPYPMLMTFDAPDSNECAAGRQTSNTPLQALTLWNDPAFVEAAQALGRRVVAEVPAQSDPTQHDPAQTVRRRGERAFLLALSRLPSDAELAEVASLYTATRDLAAQDPAAAQQLVGNPPLSSSADAAEMAGWVSVARALLNLDEFIVTE